MEQGVTEQKLIDPGDTVLLVSRLTAATRWADGLTIG